MSSQMQLLRDSKHRWSDAAIPSITPCLDTVAFNSSGSKIGYPLPGRCDDRSGREAY